MATLEELIATRINKADELRRQGIEPYPHSYEPTHNTASFLAQYGDKVEAGETLDELVRVAGRVMAVRKSGGRTFIDIEDQHGSVQAVVQRDNVGENNYALLHAVLERGDFIGIEGNVTRTKRNALSVDAQSWTMLTKAVRPLPSKEYTTEEGDRRGGLADPELMYRQPALRFIMDPSARDVMVKRSSAISLMREILERHGYMEVEIPTLQPVYGGASARPFTTRLNALGGMDLYLSISPELYLKRMLVGGFNKGVYTICKNFRNEGIDRTHNPEFTMMECYKAFVDYEWLMRLTENMWEEIFTEVNDSAQVRYAMPKSELGEQVLDFKAPWERRTMCSLVYEHTGLDVANMEEAELRERVQRVYND
ncbi:lysine--tRNA ligase, partial [Candidatus Woesearchaeota archaeon CG10_big_fil_rev_8_21_14_0_10_34_8]